jgi:probable phosphoglycerate mutase
MLPARAFWFLRHGETDWNAEGRSQGRTDVPLNATGVAQAGAAAKLLHRRGIASIVSSPLSRARDTANAAGAVLGLPVTLLDDLQEVCFGVQEGMIQSGPWFAAWVSGGSTPDGAESFAALRTRAASALTVALSHLAPVLVVAHGAWFRALRAEMGLPIDVRTPNAVPIFCEPGEPWVLTAAT